MQWTHHVPKQSLDSWWDCYFYTSSTIFTVEKTLLFHLWCQQQHPAYHSHISHFSNFSLSSYLFSFTPSFPKISIRIRKTSPIPEGKAAFNCLHQFRWRQLMVVKHVSLCPLPLWLSHCLYHYFIHCLFFPSLLLDSQGGINSMSSSPIPPSSPTLSPCYRYHTVLLLDPSSPPPHASSLLSSCAARQSMCRICCICQSILWLCVYTLNSQQLALLCTSSLLTFHSSFPLHSHRAISVACDFSFLHLNYTSRGKSQQT